ncbi:HAD-IIB family hydrolase [Acidipropionibacterium virtanenii]|uniref:Sugar phosphatase YidA n=1 Tax=Acidipropionibacterium virtanenii TaxID=2057246 RepID=A0A344UX28_9ACTN|nr:HAD-IIB family hydrolase [Acidipropionibacterium virtanenii]AXE39826.1 Sugar phosphatase YidA [Acidipropionibacterium virtanenii]
MLIATDLDGTLVRHDNTISPRARAAIAAAEEAGVPVVPVTGRQFGGLSDILGAFSRYALVNNGSMGVDLADGARTMFCETTPAATVAAFVDAVRGYSPNASFASVREEGRVFAYTDGYLELTRPDELIKDPADYRRVEVAEIGAHDCMKLMVRSAELPLEEFVARTLALTVPGAHTSWSGFPMVEMCAEGLTKATGLGRLTGLLGMTSADVVALGDGGNDVEMLSWAGRSFAMADGQQVAKDAATDIAPSAAEDGFARVVESLLESL